MSRKEPLRAVKGMRDILPPESRLWGHIEHVAREIFRTYAYQEIRTPLVEPTELFARGVGEETDIVNKEMYSWVDHESPMPALVTEALKLDLTSHPINFRRIFMEVYLPRMESELTQGTIPKTGQNIDVMKNLRQLSTQLSQLTSDDPKLTDIVRGVNFLTSRFDFGPKLSLRPEATASVVRAYIEHRLYSEPGLHRLFYMGPMFRRERPQKGRYRQFFQIGAEAIGLDTPLVDAEMISMAMTLLNKLEVKDYSLLLNSVGCRECRPIYLDRLREELTGVRERLCNDCQRRSETNPLRVFDCKVPADQPIIERLPTIADSLCEACKKHFSDLQQSLQVYGIDYTLQPRLVRGLDYYTRTTFEVVHGGLGAQNALLGGGRYDGLSEDLGGPPAPGVGFSIGEDRLASVVPQLPRTPILFIACMGEVGEPPYHNAIGLLMELRKKGVLVRFYFESQKAKKVLERASSLTDRYTPYVLIVGPDEVNEGKYQLKDMEKGQKLEPKTRDELIRFLEQKASQAQ